LSGKAHAWNSSSCVVTIFSIWKLALVSGIARVSIRMP